MNKQKIYWDNVFNALKISNKNVYYDPWLEKYENVFRESKNGQIIDLGCGLGGDTEYLINKGYNVLACDFSRVALRSIKKHIPQAKTMYIDMTKTLPFDDESISIIVADLSLHYFLWDETERIIEEIYRVLVQKGYLICRVNSIKDENFGALSNSMIEENYYYVDGCAKRFFDNKSIELLFEKWNINNSKEEIILKYGKPKTAWELLISK